MQKPGYTGYHRKELLSAVRWHNVKASQTRCTLAQQVVDYSATCASEVFHPVK